MSENKGENKYRLGLAGEFGVASELLKRGYNATVTYGNAKSVDIIVGVSNVYKTIEVKTAGPYPTTSRKPHIVTGFFQKYGDPDTKHPDYWVLVQVETDLRSRYFVLTHEQLGKIQMQRNKMDSWQSVPKGVDNVLLSSLQEYEDRWDIIEFK